MNILAVAEQRNGNIKKQGLEAVRAARSITDQTDGEVVALVIGDNVASSAPATGKYGAHRVLVAEDPKLIEYAPGAFASIIVTAVRKTGAAAVFFSATAQ